MDIVIDQDHLFGRQIRDRIDPLRIRRVVLGNRQLHTGAVFSPCAGKNDLRLPIIFPARFEKHQRSPTVDVEILNRISNAVDMVHLAREVKDDLLTFDQIIHGMGIPHIAEVDMDPVHDLFHIKEIPSQAGQSCYPQSSPLPPIQPAGQTGSIR